MIKIEKEFEKSLFVFFIIMILFISFIVIYINYNKKNIHKKEVLESFYNKTVDSVYVNKEEHNFIYVKFSDGTEESPQFNYKKNDSISKKKGDSIEYIFRKDSILKNNLFDTFRK